MRALDGVEDASNMYQLGKTLRRVGHVLPASTLLKGALTIREERLGTIEGSVAKYHLTLAELNRCLRPLGTRL